MTRDLLQEYGAKDHRISLIRKPNGGQSSARNVDLHDARGTYVAFVDHDDLLNSHMNSCSTQQKNKVCRLQNAVDEPCEKEFFMEAHNRLKNLSLNDYARYYSRSKKNS